LITPMARGPEKKTLKRKTAEKEADRLLTRRVSDKKTSPSREGERGKTNKRPRKTTRADKKFQGRSTGGSKPCGGIEGGVASEGML